MDSITVAIPGLIYRGRVNAPQRYNLMFTQGLSEREAYDIALQSGTNWLERNKNFLHGLEIVRWDEWKKDVSYQDVCQQVLKLYRTNKDFYDALQEAIEGIWTRRYANNGTCDRETFFTLSEQYLLEETAVFAVAYGAIGGVSAYPGDFLKIWEMFIDAEGPEIPKGLSKAHCVRLSFDKKVINKAPDTYAAEDERRKVSV